MSIRLSAARNDCANSSTPKTPAKARAATGDAGEPISADDLTAIEAVGGYPALVICDAVEALAATALIPALQVSLAQKESSGTNQYQRAKIDWDVIRAQLDDYVTAGQRIVNPLFDATVGYTPLLVRVVRDDIFTS